MEENSFMKAKAIQKKILNFYVGLEIKSTVCHQTPQGAYVLLAFKTIIQIIQYLTRGPDKTAPLTTSNSI